MCDLSPASQRLAPILRALSSSSRNGILCKRNAIKTEMLLASQHSLFAANELNYTRVRVTEPWEADMDAWNRNHTRYGLATLTMNSKLPIPEDMWKNAIKHIHSQAIMLRLDIIQHGNEKWLCEMNKTEPDVKLIDNQTETKVLQELFAEGIEETPLKVRIVVAQPDDFCLFPSVKEEYPYQYYFMYFYNHGLGDASSVIMIFKMLWELLEDMLAERNYMDRTHVGIYTNGEELREVISNMKIKLSNDPNTLEKEKDILEATIKTPLLNEVFSIASNSKVGTKYSHYILEENIHHSFLKKCKKNGVKISSGVVAAINTAIVEMVKDSGLQRDSYHLSVMQNVDMRRYIKNNPMTSMGFFGGRIHQSYHIVANIRENFWDHSKEINIRKSTLLKNSGPVVQDAVRQLTLQPFDPNVKRGPAQMEWDYTFNNLLDVTQHMVPNSTDFIQVTDCVPNQMTHNFTPFIITLHTFRGIARLSLSYSTNCMTEDMADELMERVLTVIKDMALS